MIIRRLIPADAPAYRRLRLYGLRECPTAFCASYEEESARSLDALAERLKPSPDSWTFGAFRGQRLVGLMTLIRDSQLKARHKAAIYGVYVAPAFRGMGVGRLLLAETLKTALALEGLRQIRLGVITANRPALRFYRKAGFAVYGKERHALLIEGRFYDETLMVLRLPRRSARTKATPRRRTGVAVA